jgi:hypothetical protein
MSMSLLAHGGLHASQVVGLAAVLLIPMIAMGFCATIATRRR